MQAAAVRLADDPNAVSEVLGVREGADI